MVGIAAIIFVVLPESPWWLASKNRLSEAEKVLTKYNGKVPGYDVEEQIVSAAHIIVKVEPLDALPLELYIATLLLMLDKKNMVATIKEENRLAEQNAEVGIRAVFQGRNSLRLLICAWPKIAQQFLGLTVFNTFATYFCE